MRAPLTERQNQLYEFIRTFIRDRGKPPTIKEIGGALAIRSTNGVHKQLVALEKKGYITRTARESRGLSLVDEDDPFAFDEGTPSLPLISRTHSAEPDELRRRPASYFDVDAKLLGRLDPDTCLIARAGDDGMARAGILKGDLLLVEERRWGQIANGTLVAALVGEALLARAFDFANNRIHLRPADRATYTDESYPVLSPECHVIGPIVGVMRRLPG